VIDTPFPRSHRTIPGVRARTICWRSRSSRIAPATRSAAHSRSTTSIRSTRDRSRIRSHSPSGYS